MTVSGVKGKNFSVGNGEYRGKGRQEVGKKQIRQEREGRKVRNLRWRMKQDKEYLRCGMSFGWRWGCKDRIRHSSGVIVGCGGSLWGDMTRLDFGKEAAVGVGHLRM